MKKVIFALVALVSLWGIGVFAADFAQPTPNSVVLCDFESIADGTAIDTKKAGIDYPIIPDEMGMFYYADGDAGKNSRLTATLVNDAAQGGKAMKIEWLLDGWCGFGIQSLNGKTGPMWNWENAKSITFYAKSGDGKKAAFVIGIADAGDERFRVAMKTEVKDGNWVKFVLPMDKFKARGDWQPATAKKNTFVDSPGTQFEFCPLSGKGSVIIDYIEINN